MMYGKKFVTAIKVGGKVLREFDEKVYLPFAAEYAILLKNLHPNKRAVAKIFIDGKNVSGGGYVISPNSESTIERFVDIANNFKFIEKTSKVAQFRGNNAEDGIVRVEFQFERYSYHAPQEPVYRGMTKGVSRGFSDGDITKSFSMNSSGITAQGGYSSQSFTTVSAFDLENEKYNMVFMLQGQTKDNECIWNPVSAPVTVKSTNQCNVCGTHNDVMSKFCKECGAGLVTYR